MFDVAVLKYKNFKSEIIGCTKIDKSMLLYFSHLYWQQLLLLQLLLLLPRIVILQFLHFIYLSIADIFLVCCDSCVVVFCLISILSLPISLSRFLSLSLPFSLCFSLSFSLAQQAHFPFFHLH